MKKSFLLFLFTFFLLKFSAAQILCVQCFEQNDSIGLNVGSANMVMNGGFENTTCAINCAGAWCPSATNYNCTISNWTSSGGGSLTYACVYDSANFFVEEGARALYFGNSYSNPCSGTSSTTLPNNDTACMVHTGCTVTGIPAGYPISGLQYGQANGLSISQTINGLIPGNTYVLEFWAGGEYQGWFNKKGMFAVDVGYGNTYLTCKITQHGNGMGTRYIIEFKANATSHILRFTNWGHVCGQCTELVLDNVRVYPTQYLPPSVTICSVGINDVAQNTITVSPNPVTDVLTVNTGTNEPSTIIIYDLLLQKILEGTFTNTIIIHTETLSKGIYIYEVRNEKGITKGKVVKE